VPRPSRACPGSLSVDGLQRLPVKLCTLYVTIGGCRQRCDFRLCQLADHARGCPEDQDSVRERLAFGDERMGADDRISPDNRMVQDYAADPNQAVRPDPAAVQHDAVAHRYALVERQRRTGVSVEHGTVLDIRAPADVDMFDVAAQYRSEPDA